MCEERRISMYSGMHFNRANLLQEANVNPDSTSSAAPAAPTALPALSVALLAQSNSDENPVSSSSAASAAQLAPPPGLSEPWPQATPPDCSATSAREKLSYLLAPSQDRINLRVVLSYTSFEIQCRKRILEGYDQGLIRNICEPRSAEKFCHIVIALCRDYAANWEGWNDPATLQTEFQTLYDAWTPNKYKVEIFNFSFKADVQCMMQLLNAATIFYMGGVHGDRRTTPIDADAQQVQQLIAMLKRKVHRSDIAYFGVCGGAMLAGRSTAFVHTPFDILEGTQVVYDVVAAKKCERKTDAVKDIVQFTCGCAVAIMLTTDTCRAVCFPTIKNKAQWQPFAAANTLDMQEWLQVQTNTKFRWGPGYHLPTAPAAPAALRAQRDSDVNPDSSSSAASAAAAPPRALAAPNTWRMQAHIHLTTQKEMQEYILHPLRQAIGGVFPEWILPVRLNVGDAYVPLHRLHEVFL